LFEWRREHETLVAGSVGNRGLLIRNKVTRKKLEEFKHTSELAKQIVLDKPSYWEHRLVLELLRSNIDKVLGSWKEVEAGVYVQPIHIIPREQISSWIATVLLDVNSNVQALDKLVSQNIMSAMGEPGVEGDEYEILRVCELVGNCCSNLLDWELRIKYLHLSDEFIPLLAFLSGIGIELVKQLQGIPDQIANIVDVETPVAGNYSIVVEFVLPDRFPENFDNILEQCGTEYYQNLYSEDD